MSKNERIKVAIRFRPRNQVELDEGNDEDPIVIEDNVITIHGKTKNHFNYDIVFPQDTDQAGIFQSVGKGIIDNVIKGFNSTLFAYGQTGSGKTYTLIGAIFGDDDSNRGLFPRCSDYLFDCLMNADDIKEAEVKMTAVEIYQEKIKDLLNDGKACQLRSNRDGTYLQGVSVEGVTCWDEIEEYMMIAMAQRQTGSTRMNQHSSRSHCILTLNVTQTLESGHLKRCRLSICDLAGSERAKKTQATGKRFSEGCQINKSLSALGQVIADLAAKKKFVNFRNSKLTFLLKESLQGNTKTVLMATATLDAYNLTETLSTLRFASRAITIVNKVSKQIHLGPEQMRKMITKLKGVLLECCNLMLKMEGKKSVTKFESGIQSCLSRARSVLADEFPGADKNVGSKAASRDEVSSNSGSRRSSLNGSRRGSFERLSDEDVTFAEESSRSPSFGIDPSLHRLHRLSTAPIDLEQEPQAQTNIEPIQIADIPADADIGKIFKQNETYRQIIEQSRMHWESLRDEFRQQRRKDADTIQHLKKDNRRMSQVMETNRRSVHGQRLSAVGSRRAGPSSRSPQEEKYRKIMDDNAHLIQRLTQAKNNRAKRSKMKRTIKHKSRNIHSSNRPPISLSRRRGGTDSQQADSRKAASTGPGAKISRHGDILASLTDRLSTFSSDSSSGEDDR